MLQITCVPLINSLPAGIICDSFDLVVVQWNCETQTLRRAKSVLSGDESRGQYAVPLTQGGPAAYLTDGTTDEDTADQHVIPLHTPLDVAPPVPPQTATSVDFPELPPPSEQWI